MKENILKNSAGEIWRAGHSYMVYVSNSDIAKRIALWKDSVLSATYYVAGTPKQYNIPKKKLCKVMQMFKNSDLSS